MEKILKLNELVQKADPELEVVVQTTKKPRVIINKKDVKIEELIDRPICIVVEIDMDYLEGEVLLIAHEPSIRAVCSLDNKEETIKILNTLFSPLNSVSSDDLVFFLNTISPGNRRRFHVGDDKIIITNSRVRNVIIASLTRSIVDSLIQRNRLRDLFTIGNISNRQDIDGLLSSKLFDLGLKQGGNKLVRYFKIPVSCNMNLKILIIPQRGGTLLVSFTAGKHLSRVSNIIIRDEKEMDSLVDILEHLLSLSGTKRVIEMINTLTPAVATIENEKYKISIYDNEITHSLYVVKPIFKDIANILKLVGYSLINKGQAINIHPSPRAKTIEELKNERKERQEYFGFK